LVRLFTPSTFRKRNCNAAQHRPAKRPKGKNEAQKENGSYSLALKKQFVYRVYSVLFQSSLNSQLSYSSSTLMKVSGICSLTHFIRISCRLVLMVIFLRRQ